MWDNGQPAPWPPTASLPRGLVACISSLSKTLSMTVLPGSDFPDHGIISL